MGYPNLKLVRPHISDRISFLSGLKELSQTSDQLAWVYLGDSGPLDFPERDFDGYVRELLRRETTCPPGFVTDKIYWAKVGDEVVGRISLRHELNDFLKRFGGHIGYIVRPTWRGKGVATEMLKQMLETDRAQKIGRVLLTCDQSNGASEKTIVRNGGRLEDIVDAGPGRSPRKRFWIDL